jgi:hypothetical protein
VAREPEGDGWARDAKWLSNGAGVQQEPASSKEAYAPFPEPKSVPFRENFLRARPQFAFRKCGYEKNSVI